MSKPWWRQTSDWVKRRGVGALPRGWNLAFPINASTFDKPNTRFWRPLTRERRFSNWPNGECENGKESRMHASVSACVLISPAGRVQSRSNEMTRKTPREKRATKRGWHDSGWKKTFSRILRSRYFKRKTKKNRCGKFFCTKNASFSVTTKRKFRFEKTNPRVFISERI